MRSIISLLLILILSSCNNELDLKNNFSPNIKVINESSTSSNKINSWINYASQKMSNQNANILSVSWNVGDFVNEGGFDRPFNTNEVIISEDKIENLVIGFTSLSVKMTGEKVISDSAGHSFQYSYSSNQKCQIP